MKHERELFGSSGRGKGCLLLGMLGAWVMAGCQVNSCQPDDQTFMRYRKTTPEITSWKGYRLLDAFEYAFTVFPGAKMVLCLPVESDPVEVEARDAPVDLRLLIAVAPGPAAGIEPQDQDFMLVLLGLTRRSEDQYKQLFAVPLRTADGSRAAAGTYDLESGGTFFTATDSAFFPVMWQQLFRLLGIGWCHYHLVPVDATLSDPCSIAESQWK
jgi:hypothetical protein